LNELLAVGRNDSLALITTSGAVSANIPLALADPRSLSQQYTVTNVFTAASAINFDAYFLDELTDGAGHGLLLATDTIYLAMYSANKVTADNYVVKLAYRWKEVSLVEYIGIVQSQQ
jgi:hypothetical protein